MVEVGYKSFSEKEKWKLNYVKGRTLEKAIVCVLKQRLDKYLLKRDSEGRVTQNGPVEIIHNNLNSLEEYIKISGRGADIKIKWGKRRTELEAKNTKLRAERESIQWAEREIHKRYSDHATSRDCVLSETDVLSDNTQSDAERRGVSLYEIGFQVNDLNYKKALHILHKVLTPIIAPIIRYCKKLSRSVRSKVIPTIQITNYMDKDSIIIDNSRKKRVPVDRVRFRVDPIQYILDKYLPVKLRWPVDIRSGYTPPALSPVCSWEGLVNFD